MKWVQLTVGPRPTDFAALQTFLARAVRYIPVYIMSDYVTIHETVVEMLDQFGTLRSVYCVCTITGAQYSSSTVVTSVYTLS